MSESTAIPVRLVARLRGAALDHELAVGESPSASAALAVRAGTLTTRRERTRLARTLRCIVREARHDSPRSFPKVPIDVEQVREASEDIDALVLSLLAPYEVEARGVACLRELLSDGAGPLYRGGSGDLRAALMRVLHGLGSPAQL